MPQTGTTGLSSLYPSAWTTGVTDTKGIIEFAVDDYNTYPVCYSPTKTKYTMVRGLKDLFRLTKDSISTLIENSNEYQKRCAFRVTG